MKNRYPIIVSLGLIMVALAGFVSWRCYGRVPHIEDEHAYLFQAKVFADGKVVAASPPFARPFQVPFVIDRDGRRFSKYPPGFSFLLALGVLVGLPWIVNALCGALVLVAVYLIGADLLGPPVGLCAALLGLLSPLLLLQSSVLMSHVSCCAALSFFAWTFWRCRDRRRRHPLSYAIGAGLCLGLGVLIRPLTAAGIGAAFLVLAVVDLFRSPGFFVRRYGVMLASGLLVAVLSPFYSYAATGDPFTNLYTMWEQCDTIGFGPGHGTVPTGHSLGISYLNLRRDLGQLRELFLPIPRVLASWLGAALLTLGLFSLAWRNARMLPLLVAPPLLLICAYLAYWVSSGGAYGPRYYLEGLPWVWLIVAHGLVSLSTSRYCRVVTMVGLPIVAVWGIRATTIPQLRQGQGLYGITRRDSNTIEAAHLGKALVFVKGSDWTDYGALSWKNSASLDGEVVIAASHGLRSDRRVQEFFPGRRVYYYDRSAERLGGPPP